MKGLAAALALLAMAAADPSAAATDEPENIFTTPGAFRPKADEEAPAPMKGPFISLKDGRGVLEAGASLSLRRLPEGPATHPVTKSITPFGDWKVACESRGDDQACFAAAYTQVDGITLKAKFGIASPPEPTAPSDPGPEPAPPAGQGKSSPRTAKPVAKTTTPSPARGPVRYVFDLEGPPGLDGDTGYAIVASRAVGFLSLERGCDKNACRAVAEVSKEIAPLVAPDAPEEGGFAVMASAGGRSFLWRFSTAGLREAFEKVRSENEKGIRTAAGTPPSGPPQKAEGGKPATAPTAPTDAKAKPATVTAAAAKAVPGAVADAPVRIVAIHANAARPSAKSGHRRVADSTPHVRRRHGGRMASAEGGTASGGRFVPGQR